MTTPASVAESLLLQSTSSYTSFPVKMISYTYLRTYSIDSVLLSNVKVYFFGNLSFICNAALFVCWDTISGEIMIVAYKIINPV